MKRMCNHLFWGCRFKRGEVQTKTTSFNGINHLKSHGSIFIWESILFAGEGARVI
jgi:hypothetical protein